MNMKAKPKKPRKRMGASTTALKSALHLGNIILITTTAPDGAKEMLLGRKKPKQKSDQGRKRKRVGIGKWVPAGGKNKLTDKSNEHAASRECREETGYDILVNRFVQIGLLEGYFGEDTPDPIWAVNLYHIELPFELRDEFKFEAVAFDDMRWFKIKDLPWDDMLPADRQWIPQLLIGEQLRIKIRLDKEGERLLSYSATPERFS